MNMQFCLVFLLLLTLNVDCEISGALIRSFRDDDGSPGPPTVTSEEYSSVSTENLSDCDFHTKPVIATNNLINVDIAHHLFKTDILVPGVVYQGKSRFETGTHFYMHLLCNCNVRNIFNR